MLQLEKNRLPVYFGSESGQALPGFLQRLDQQLDTENKKLRADVETLVGHFGHIREIIVMQQNSARLFGVTETLAASELVQDAVTVNIDSLRRHEVDLRRLMDEVPPVRADRHKVLQILVNLIKNAKDSVVASRAAGRQICLRIALQDEKTVAIAVEDNGAGIAPEVVGKIFQHGFTTKKDGHGFGLHSSVLAAREMSGDLTATSTGPAGGARFTLTLPIAGVQPL
jgi:C4-dicarboxylate-specific signal transduction histidine kinase